MRHLPLVALALTLAAFLPAAFAQAWPSMPIQFVVPYPPGGPLDIVARLVGINPALYPNIPYDAAKDFIAVTQLASKPNVLVVNPSVPATTVKEFIAYAKANPGKLSFGSGSAGHIAGELFKSFAGVDMVHVPYKGAEPVGSPPPEFAAYVKAEAEKCARLVKASGARVD